VDGANVVGSRPDGWWRDRPGAARRLHHRLAVADIDQLDQVLWALLDNAAKYGRGAPVRASISARQESSQVAVTIADRGPGVSPADRDLLFARFARASNAGPDGTGLGLYVSRELCRAMGGDLVLDEAGRGGGASFTVVLPGEPPEEPEEAPASG